MQASSRVIINTVAQYLKTFLNIIISLYSVRLILGALGEEDYGIYSLIAGVVSMLSFITNSLSATTQRYLSYHSKNSTLDHIRNIFSNSVLLHLIIGVIVAVCLLGLENFCFQHFFNISYERIFASKFVYISVILLVLTIFFTTPFRAVLIAHENIVFLSFVDVLDSVLRLISAVFLTFFPFDKLITYSFLLLAVHFFDFILLSIYSFKKYKECTFRIFTRLDKNILKELTSFTGWNVYGVACIVFRSQGIAVVLNKFFNAVVNAAYGLAFQIVGYINFMSDSLLNALKPQIMSAEGVGDRTRMLTLSCFACKYSFFLLSCLAIPCLFEFPSLLNFLLGDVPQYSSLFCRMAVLGGLIDSLTLGFAASSQAIGVIKQYSLYINSIKVITLPVVYFALKCGYNIQIVAICYIVFEFICAIARLPFLRKYGNLNISLFIKNVFGREFFPLLVFVLCCVIITYYFDFKYRFFITFIIPNVIYILLFYFIGMDNYEKNKVRSIFNSFINKINFSNK